IIEFECDGEAFRATDGERTITHGLGYTLFQKNYNNFNICQTIFVPQNRNNKVTIITIKNNSSKEKELAVSHRITPTLGVSNRKTWYYIESTEENGALILQNKFNEQYENIKVFLTCDSPCTADTNNYSIKTTITIPPNSTKEFTFELGIFPSAGGVPPKEAGWCPSEELTQTKSFWRALTKSNIKTGHPANDILLGGWLTYQNIASRLFARSGFYQCGGAFGFRDQLQDCLAIFKIMPELARKIIIQSCAHQYVEGDVQHWFHLPRRGVRTRIVDDLLWLPYVTMEYARQTGDNSIWNEEVHFLQSPILEPHEHERYEIPEVSPEKATVYEHCRRAIEKSLKFGKHGLPLIGGGDWNDGFSHIGTGGSGESVWLAFFLIDILKKWKKITPPTSVGDDGNRPESAAGTPRAASPTHASAPSFVGGAVPGAPHFEESHSPLTTDDEQLITDLTLAANTHGWNGKWYLRAFYDDGSPLGNPGDPECEIDLLVQSWAVLSGAGDPEKCKSAIVSALAKLVDYENGIIKLLSPPFSHCESACTRSNPAPFKKYKSFRKAKANHHYSLFIIHHSLFINKNSPGYIANYAPGVRENGAQYTHAAAWFILALHKMGELDKAKELFTMINPIIHSDTKEAAHRYQREPYVLCGDVYSAPNLEGTGGWSWYTGSSAWMQIVGQILWGES
ncbi:MAG: hypothetical protein FWE47_03965, partial [Oscillospiraceae bacterium]|nr:hypothetical protein [Oscillospiraceae bacterium]